MYKFFTSRYGRSIEDNILKLRKDFPNMQFIPGINKDIKGIWCLKDTTTREYGEKVELENGDVLSLPTEENIQKIIDDLKKYESNQTIRIPIELVSGTTVSIFPASAIPKKAILSLRTKVVQEEELPYNTKHEYGKIAYKLYLRSQKNEDLKSSDPDLGLLIKLAFENSYNLPIEVIDSLGIVSIQDYDKLFAASMGYDWEALMADANLSNSV